MAKPDLCARVMSLDRNIMGAFLLRNGTLDHWKMRKGLKLPEPEKVSTMMFQRTLVHTLLKEREEYVGRMHYNLTSYDQVDIFHFSLEEPRDNYPLLLVTVRKPYDHELLVAKVLRTVKGWHQVKWT